MSFFDYFFYDADGNVIFESREESIENAVIVFLNDCRIDGMGDAEKLYFAEKRSGDLLLQTYQLGELQSLKFL